MRYYRSVSVAFAVLLVAGCALLWATKSSASEEFASIRIWDNCDPETFNEAVGPDTCIPGAHGTELFSLFIQEVTLDKLAGAWRFGAAKYTLPQGRNTKLDNRGGELHTLLRWPSLAAVSFLSSTSCQETQYPPRSAFSRKTPPTYSWKLGP